MVVMQFLGGHSLTEEYLGTLNVHEKRNLFDKVKDAIRLMHNNCKLVHGDLRGPNIIVLKFG